MATSHGMGLDPSPFLGVVSDIRRRYADALEPRAPPPEFTPYG